MLTKEDLQAISGLLEPIKKDISDVKSDISVMKRDISILKSDVEELKENMAEVKMDTNEIGKWIDKYFSGTMPFPVDDEEDQEIKDVLESMKEKH